MSRTRDPSWSASAPSDYEQREIARWPGWRGLIGWDVFLNNLAAGTGVIAVLGAWCAPASMGGLLAPALTLALMVLALDLVLLVADLGDPWRFLHMLRVVKRTSPMSVGVWSLSLYGPLLALAAVAAWLGYPVARWLGLAALVPAMGVLAYKGVLFSCTSQPGLRDGRWLAAHLASSGLMLGAAALTWLAVGVQPLALPALRTVLAALIVPACVTLALLLPNVWAQARVRHPPGVRAVIAAGVVGAGLLLPLAMLVSSRGAAAAFLAAVLVLVGGLVLRHFIVRLPEPVDRSREQPRLQSAG
jgi:formate-dependent nitrite reductase membrane component NrfD